jgi:outer membrane protein assembly factor BamB
LRAGIQTFVLSPHCRLYPSWQQSFDSPDAGSAPTIAEGVLYIGTGRNGVLRAYRLNDGQRLWAAGLGATSFTTPSVADGRVFAGTWRGDLWAFRAG